MARKDLLFVAGVLMTVTAPLPGEDDGELYPVLGIDSNFEALPADNAEGTVDDTITQDTVIKLAVAAIRAIRIPTDAMRQAGALRLAALTVAEDAARQTLAGDIFKAMIDELLRE